jgi:predicted transcriptional regulator
MEDLMALVKEEVIRMIQNMPQDASIEDIMAELYFRYQVDEGLKQLDEGKGIPHEDVEKRMERWLKK